jgi:glycosyltransferase involved in cell wall biosynthesis
VAMCTYNGDRFLPQQLASIRAQTRLPDELVVCDDCSTDQTRTLLEQFATSAPFPVQLHFNERNLGSTKNFEQSIELATGELIALCDQDDIWRPEKLARSEAIFKDRSEVGLTFTDGDIVDEEGRLEGHTLWQILDFDRDQQSKVRTEAAFDVLNHGAIVTGSTMSFRAMYKDLVLPIPGDLPLIHDGWIALLISTTAEVAPISEPLIKYRQHQTQQVGVRRSERKAAGNLLDAARRKTTLGPEIDKLRAVRDRLAAQRNRYQFKIERQIDMRLKHLETRAWISKRKVVNAPYVLREVLTWRYHRYSNGFYSALKDLLW